VVECPVHGVEGAPTNAPTTLCPRFVAAAFAWFSLQPPRLSHTLSTTTLLLPAAVCVVFVYGCRALVSSFRSGCFRVVCAATLRLSHLLFTTTLLLPAAVCVVFFYG